MIQIQNYTLTFIHYYWQSWAMMTLYQSLRIVMRNFVGFWFIVLVIGVRQRFQSMIFSGHHLFYWKWVRWNLFHRSSEALVSWIIHKTKLVSNGVCIFSIKCFYSTGIFDLEGLSLNHVWYVTPSVVKRILALMVVSILKLYTFPFEWFCIYKLQ